MCVLTYIGCFSSSSRCYLQPGSIFTEFKQQYFAPIQSLDADDQTDILSRVVSGELSLGELKIETQERKQIKLPHTAFAKLTNCEFWLEAQDCFPQYAISAKLFRAVSTYRSEEDATALIHLSFAHVQRVQIALKLQFMLGMRVYQLSAIVLQSKVNELSCQTVRSVMPTFSGASLIISTINEDVSACKMEYKHILYILI